MPSSRTARYLVHLALGFALTWVLLPGYVELFPMNVFHKAYATWRAQLDYASLRADPEPELLVIGDSRIHAAVLPVRLEARARSLALGGATPIEGYFVLRRYLQHHAAPRRIFLSFAPFHFGEADAFWERTVKFKALHADEAFEVFRRAEDLNDDVLGSSDARQLALKWLRYRFNLVTVYAPELQKSKLFLRREAYLERRRVIDRDAGHHYYGNMHGSAGLNREAKALAFETSPLLEAYLHDLLELAAEHGIRVVMTTMPMNQSSYVVLRPALVRGYRDYMQRLAEKHPEVVIQGEIWSLPDDFFGDSSHVNPRGAQLVSDWMASIARREG